VPPHRRRPVPTSGQAPPIRRPKVAGLRNRPGHPDEPAEVESAEPTESAEPEVEPVTGAGVLNGILGERPAAAEPPAEPDAAEPEPARKPRHTAAAAPVTRSKPRPADGDRRPAGKRRATGAARPADLTSAETDAGAARPARHARVEDPPARTAASTYLSTAIVLAVVAVVLAGLAFFFRGKADAITSGDSNSALTDSAGTSQVVGQLSNAIKQTFSYNYTDLDATAKAVKENLTGKALCEYNLLFGEVKQYAPQQKIVLATTVREIALVRLEGDRAEALVYIDQSSTRVDVNKTVAVGGQFAVMAQRQGDHWKITEFDMFGQPLFDGKPAPKC